MQDETIKQVARKIMPSRLAELVLAADNPAEEEIIAITGITQESAKLLIEKLRTWSAVLDLQVWRSRQNRF